MGSKSKKNANNEANGNRITGTDRQKVNREPAKIARSPDGDPIGVAIYLSTEDLRALGVSECADAVVPRIKSGTVLLEKEY